MKSGIASICSGESWRYKSIEMDLGATDGEIDDSWEGDRRRISFGAIRWGPAEEMVRVGVGVDVDADVDTSAMSSSTISISVDSPMLGSEIGVATSAVEPRGAAEEDVEAVPSVAEIPALVVGCLVVVDRFFEAFGRLGHVRES